MFIFKNRSNTTGPRIITESRSKCVTISLVSINICTSSVLGMLASESGAFSSTKSLSPSHGMVVPDRMEFVKHELALNYRISDVV